jgi:hypothetical protein
MRAGSTSRRYGEAIDCGSRSSRRIAAGRPSVLLRWVRLDPRLDALGDGQYFADVEARVYPAD